MKQLTLDEVFRTVNIDTTAIRVECMGKDYVAILENIGDLQQPSTPPKRCGCAVDCLERCRNRRGRIECDQNTCALNLCSNRNWTQYAANPVKLQVRETFGKGLGAFAAEPISRGSIVREYVDEIITEEELQQRKITKPPVYTMEYALGQIDASRYGNESRLFNHSCEPNCQAEEWVVLGEYRIGIAATRSIYQGEEITFDYGNDYYLKPCLCSKCKALLVTPTAP